MSRLEHTPWNALKHPERWTYDELLDHLREGILCTSYRATGDFNCWASLPDKPREWCFQCTLIAQAADALERLRPRVQCFCGAPAREANNTEVYGKQFGHGKIWLCTRYPTCEGRVGAHPHGAPLGPLADQRTRDARRKVHELMDPLWGNGHMEKKEVYRRMREEMGGGDFQVGHLDVRGCTEAIVVLQKVWKEIDGEPDPF
jgi:hypothetical protein